MLCEPWGNWLWQTQRLRARSAPAHRVTSFLKSTCRREVRYQWTSCFIFSHLPQCRNLCAIYRRNILKRLERTHWYPYFLATICSSIFIQYSYPVNPPLSKFSFQVKTHFSSFSFLYIHFLKSLLDSTDHYIFFTGRGGSSGGKFRLSLALPVGAVVNCADNTGNVLNRINTFHNIMLINMVFFTPLPCHWLSFCRLLPQIGYSIFSVLCHVKKVWQCYPPSGMKQACL